MSKKISIIKQTVSMERLAGLLDLRPRRVGASLGVNPCPQCGHRDCFRIDPAKDLYHCFSCGAGGDIIDLYCLVKQCGTAEAIDGIAIMAGISLSSQGRRPDQARGILDQVAEFYADLAARSDTFQAYLQGRAMRRHDSFLIGYADPATPLHQQFSAHLEELAQCGLVVPASNGRHRDLFLAPCMIYPWRGTKGEVRHLRGRVLPWARKTRAKIVQPPRGKSDAPPFFGMHQRADTIWIVEGEADAVALAQAGAAAWATGGPLTDLHVGEIQRLLEQGVNIVQAFDADEAGQRYAAKLRAACAGLPPEAARRVDDGKTGELRQAAIPAGHKDPEEAIRAGAREWVDAARPVYRPLRQCLDAYRASLGEDEKWSADTAASIIYTWFAASGVWFVRDAAVYLSWRGKVIQLAADLPMKALLFREAGINHAHRSSRAIWEAIAAIAYDRARHVSATTWLHTDQARPSIAWHIGNDTEAVLTSGQVTTRPAGTGKVVLTPAPKLLPIRPLAASDPLRGIASLARLADQALACSPSWRAYLCGMIANTLLLGWTKAHGIHTFTGSMGSGKSEGAAFITAAIYGHSYVTAGSTASYYTDAASNPLVVLDNLETRNMGPRIRDFLLHAGTGIVRQKRKSGTDDQNVYEKSMSQIITTSIEQPETPELIERTILIQFSDQYFSAEHPGAGIIEERIIAARDEIWSGIMHLVAGLLPELAQRRAQLLRHLSKRWPRHGKRRLNEHLATVALLVEAMAKHFGLPPGREWLGPDATAQHLLSLWITEQDRMARSLAAETNPIVRYLDLLAREIRRGRSSISMSPGHDGQDRDGQGRDGGDSGGRIEFEADLAAVLAEFDLIARAYQLRDRYHSVRHLAVRIVNEHDTLGQAGWRVEKLKKVRGRQVYRFSKT